MGGTGHLCVPSAMRACYCMYGIMCLSMHLRCSLLCCLRCCHSCSICRAAAGCCCSYHTVVSSHQQQAAVKASIWMYFASI
jgi:hypothetical protein